MLNCKVICIDDRGGVHTKGKIYNVVNGRIESDTRGHYHPMESGFKSLHDINNYMTSQFGLYDEHKFENLKDKYFSMAKEQLLLFVDEDNDSYMLSGDHFVGNKLSVEIKDLDTDLSNCIRIVRIYKVNVRNYHDDFASLSSNHSRHELIWERIVRKHTMSELRYIVGYGFDVVSEEEKNNG